MKTKAIASSSAISSSFETPTQIAATRTMTAARRWIRMFRCVRTTWMIPSTAKLKLSSRVRARRWVSRSIAPRGSASRTRGRNRAGAGRRSRAAPPLPPPLRARLFCVQLLGLDDPLHEPVPHDVLVAEANEGDRVDGAEDVLDVDQARRLLARKVDLRDVAGDHHLGAEAEAR